MSLSAIFAIVFIILFVTVIALTCGEDEERKEEPVEKPVVVKEQETVDGIIIPSDYEELKIKYVCVRQKGREILYDAVLYSIKIDCLYFAIDCGEPFTFDKVWNNHIETSDDEEDDTHIKEMYHKALFQIVCEGYLAYDNEKHTYTPTFYA